LAVTQAGDATYTISYFPGGILLEPLFTPPCWVDQNCVQSDFWETIGRLYEGIHWLYLADFGQISATEYLGYGSDAIDWTQAKLYSPTSNVFVNSSLYQAARDASPRLYFPNWQPSYFGVPEFNETDALPQKANESIVLVQSYLCQQRKLKHPLNLLLTVLAADYALIVGGYGLVVLIASLIQKRRKVGTPQESYT
jgi:hypothetical protein